MQKNIINKHKTEIKKIELKLKNCDSELILENNLLKEKLKISEESNKNLSKIIENALSGIVILQQNQQ